MAQAQAAMSGQLGRQASKRQQPTPPSSQHQHPQGDANGAGRAPQGQTRIGQPGSRPRHRTRQSNGVDVVAALKRICSEGDPRDVYRGFTKIGQGASGGVYTGHERGSNRLVAIKQMNLEQQPKKDLIINAYGKNISPTEIETALRSEPLISQAVVVGDSRPYLTALLTLDVEAAADWATKTGRSLAVEAGADDPVLRDAIGDAVDRVNASHSHVEAIRRWRLLPHELSVAAAELTPTLKVRREQVITEFADLVEEMYAA